LVILIDFTLVVVVIVLILAFFLFIFSLSNSCHPLAAKLLLPFLVLCNIKVLDLLATNQSQSHFRLIFILITIFLLHFLYFVLFGL
jgi:hypothetical protein